MQQNFYRYFFVAFVFLSFVCSFICKVSSETFLQKPVKKPPAAVNPPDLAWEPVEQDCVGMFCYPVNQLAELTGYVDLHPTAGPCVWVGSTGEDGCNTQALIKNFLIPDSCAYSGSYAPSWASSAGDGNDCVAGSSLMIVQSATNFLANASLINVEMDLNLLAQKLIAAVNASCCAAGVCAVANADTTQHETLLLPFSVCKPGLVNIQSKISLDQGNCPFVETDSACVPAAPGLKVNWKICDEFDQVVLEGDLQGLVSELGYEAVFLPEGNYSLTVTFDGSNKIGISAYCSYVVLTDCSVNKSFSLSVTEVEEF